MTLPSVSMFIIKKGLEKAGMAYSPAFISLALPLIFVQTRKFSASFINDACCNLSDILSRVSPLWTINEADEEKSPSVKKSR